MENDVIQRINEVILESRISITSLSKAVGIPQPTLYKQVSGNSSMSLAVLYSLLNYFKDVSAEWLLRGEGSMMKGEPQQQSTPQDRIVGEIRMDENGNLNFKLTF